MDDRKLMRLYLAGDSSAFEAIYRAHSGRVLAYLRKRLDHPEEVDEVLQAIFLKFHHSRDQYDPKYPVLQWLYVVSRTTLLDHLRKSGRRPRTVDIEDFKEILADEVSQQMAEPTLKDKAEIEILEDLPPEQRQAVEMRIFDELSYDQIAAKLGKSQDGVRQMVSRALRKMKAVYEQG